MKPHEKILQMLETVSKDDEKTLDEIDARFCCYINNYPYVSHYRNKGESLDSFGMMIIMTDTPNVIISFCSYTRSIDAQNAVKLEKNYGWRIGVFTDGRSWSTVWRWGDVEPPTLATEAISRLHTLVQIKADERGD